MYPNTFVHSFWTLNVRRQVFVAMSFHEKFEPRFNEVLAPAIRDHKVDAVTLQPYRVDLSKSGDSILADIIDGIAHSQLVVADVSTIGRDSVTDRSYRNGNVMYEVWVSSCDAAT